MDKHGRSHDSSWIGTTMQLRSDEKVVRRGTFLYDGVVLCDIRIVYSTFMPGSGDYQDPPEVADDRDGDFFYVQYGSTTARGVFNAGGGGGTTLEAAITAAESTPGIGPTVVWID